MRLTDQQLRDVLGRAEEIQRRSPSAAMEAEREAVIEAGEAIGLERGAIERALREQTGLTLAAPNEGDLVFALSRDGKYYVAEVLSQVGDAMRVQFMQGSEHTVALDEVRACSFLPGERIVVNWPWWGPWTSTVVSFDLERRLVTVSDGWGSEARVALTDVWLNPSDAAGVNRTKLTVKWLAWGAAAGGVLGSVLTWWLVR